jgi:hypothetical protein
MRRSARRWDQARRAAEGGPRILIATSMGGYRHGALLESALAVALTLRGARVGILLCDSFLPACQLSEIASVPPRTLLQSTPQPRCATCHPAGRAAFGPLRVNIQWLGGLISSSRAREASDLAASIPADELGTFRSDGMALGEHALAGALRYFARGDLDGEALGEHVTRRYLEAALRTAWGVQELVSREAYTAVCFNHGIYVPQGIIGEVCRQRTIRVVNWNPAYRRHTFIFSHGDSYHHTMLEEPVSEWESLPWTAALEEQTLSYLRSRWRGSEDWIWFHDQPREDIETLAAELRLDLSRPWIALLPNVIWDAQLHYEGNAFPTMWTWLAATVDYFRSRPDLQLVIRAHPAEVRGAIPSRQRVDAELRRAFPELPSNVVIIPPDHPLSTYALVERCDTALIYGTKTGIEISSAGIPVIVAGEAWIRGKGFSLDARSTQEYTRLLDRLPLRRRLTGPEIERARKYAFHFFFRRMIPLPFIAGGRSEELALRVDRLEDLAPGRYPGLDVICDGILHGSRFVYPAEQEPAAPSLPGA